MQHLVYPCPERERADILNHFPESCAHERDGFRIYRNIKIVIIERAQPG